MAEQIQRCIDPDMGLSISFRNPNISMDDFGLMTCVDLALFRNDVEQVKRLITMDRLFLERPMKTLMQYVERKLGEEIYTETLDLLLSKGVYEVDWQFLEYVIKEVDLAFALKIIKSISSSKRAYRGDQRTILHLAVARMNFELYACVCDLWTPLNVEGDDGKNKRTMNVNSRDRLGQTPLFYFVHCKF